MLFEFDSDQQLWQKTVREVTAKECPPTLVRAVVDSGADPAPLWKTYVGMGWTELADPESAVELAIVIEELGRATDPTPFLATTTQFAPLAGVTGPDRAGAAVYEGVKAYRDSTGWVLHGTALRVLDGDRAEQLAVVTEAGVFTVDADKVAARRSPVFDPVLHVADLSFDGVRVEGEPRTGIDVEGARHIALTGLALSTVGACQRVLDLALDHVRNRQQFGVPIGSFQAVKHRATDMHVAIQRARALAYFAALTVAENDPRRRLAASMAKAAAGECQSLVFRSGLQLFGAMGFTWENDLQFALKRARAAEHMLGSASEHRALIAEEYRATFV
ncbi:MULTISPECIES: acyl-CoA dehydrogenase family protein [unclassified Rhodococcus (in: high G+C Gram-positive bacteria)]|uniref:acyl-CoA dehydrogenase family protein n=1 Tax=unclassified Rhodococcus (in: high G+C Gram-positive bacteria) TaxID=192944 RepID=UPI00146A4233|nr:MULTISPECIES: acyl-CoA dehydrogenase family protein [unclassified Rhodococcus (in: high G+C Gram-positive bacteria)]MBF0662361.1 acyl-CoA dehydrogenase family protein [Rhodococcus sp. (in: high G+C Gram-positive bacteria)]NMD96699.1 acyl-CoA dehydrogenase [Rhodococcus sp. BL-253-APC-6A1W]NME78160.1 acyl-CoA dehydrogenase [Rhodococcus sp. 105337]